MALEKRKILVIREYTVLIDSESEIVKEYENTGELLKHLIDYEFNEVLPVINNGVKVEDSEIMDWDSYEI